MSQADPETDIKHQVATNAFTLTNLQKARILPFEIVTTNLSSNTVVVIMEYNNLFCSMFFSKEVKKDLVKFFEMEREKAYVMFKEGRWL